MWNDVAAIRASFFPPLYIRKHMLPQLVQQKQKTKQNKMKTNNKKTPPAKICFKAIM